MSKLTDDMREADLLMGESMSLAFGSREEQAARADALVDALCPTASLRIEGMSTRLADDGKSWLVRVDGKMLMTRVRDAKLERFEHTELDGK